MGIVALILTLAGIVIALFWIALPCLVNATNTRLDKLIIEVQSLRYAIEKQKS